MGRATAFALGLLQVQGGSFSQWHGLGCVLKGPFGCCAPKSLGRGESGAGREVRRVSEVKGAQVAQTHKVATGSLRLFLRSGKAQLLRLLCQAARASGLNAS